MSARKREPDPGPTEAEIEAGVDESERVSESREDVDRLTGVDLGAEVVDDDELDEEDLLDIDQTELDELGLTLDDPHQPEPE